MSKARLVITALFVEGQTAAEVARRYGVHRAWVYKLKARYLAEGDVAFEPRSRRPKTSPRATAPATVELVLALRKQLAEQGLDAGADTIGWHLQHHHDAVLSRATIHRILTRHAAVTPDPAKRPRSSYIRFAAEQPNECWQSDFTHYRLTRPDGSSGVDVEIISWLDDHSRYALSVTAHPRITGPIVLTSFRETLAQFGIPASTLTDNGMVFTTRLSGGKGGRNGLETELRRLNIIQKNSRPNHPTTSRVGGAVPADPEEVAARPTRSTLHPAELQVLLDTFVAEYNQRRPHRSLPHRCTPATAYTARPKATPRADRTGEVHHRVRTDRVDDTGVVTLRAGGRLHHIGIGRTHARTHVLILVQDLQIRVVDAATGELLRELILDPTKDYQPTGRPPGPARRHPK